MSSRRFIVTLSLSAVLAVSSNSVLSKRIDIGDLRLRVMQKGKGSPTVVFDSGLGDTLESWRWVWPEVSKFTRVFLYDRAGLGRSDPGPGPRSSQQMVVELHALLEAAGARPPYVLVGHSMGGLNLRLFASQHPEKVSALVLVDATPLDFPGREAELHTEFERRKLNTMLSLNSEGSRREKEAIEQSVEQLRRAKLPDIPVIVLSSTRPEESDRFRKAWLDMQRRMAARVSAIHHVVTQQSGHYLQFDEPHLVIEAVRDAVEWTRKTEPANP